MKTIAGKKKVNRREFMLSSAAGMASFTIAPRHVLGGAGDTPPSEKLNIAAIGAGGRGAGDLAAVSSENIVALCDVDEARAADAFKRYPQAKRYTDFRVMLEKEHKLIDAVIVATPDHTHAVASMMAIKMGKHVYCEKPLTHSVYEARKITEAAREAKVATQLGNQGQASEEARVLQELILDGAIGHVRQIHCWSKRKGFITPRGIPRPKETPPVPPTLDWDLWLGPAPYRPYHPAYLPFKWRGWWDFGTGVIGDIGCHQFSAIFKALKLGHPEWVQACSTNDMASPEIAAESAPLGSIVRYHFAAQGNRPAVEMTWWDGGMMPRRPEELEPERKMGGRDGALYIGDKGKILGHRLIPESKMQEYGKVPKVLDRSGGHHQEWIDACKGGKPAGSSFIDHAGLLTEVVLLGLIAIRTKEKLYWDGDNMRFTNSETANQYLNPPYRNGWSL
ncbi:MAG: Gfo/Idh/MocA family protein [Planctomycetota bacterium]|jgi:predicted dehydrogenase